MPISERQSSAEISVYPIEADTHSSIINQVGMDMIFVQFCEYLYAPC